MVKIILLLVVIGLGVLALVLVKTKKPSSFVKYYTAAESPSYKILSKELGVVKYIYDKKLNLYLTPEPACEVSVSADIKNKKGEEFYNDTVGITLTTPYKSLSYDDKTDEFVQTVLNSGCVFEEGRIKITTDVQSKAAKCEVKVKYKFLGC